MVVLDRVPPIKQRLVDLFTAAEPARRDQASKIGSAFVVSLDVAGQAESSRREHAEELLREVVAVVGDGVVLVRRVFLAHAGHEHVVHLEGRQLADGLRGRLAFDGYRKFEGEGAISLGHVEVYT